MKGTSRHPCRRAAAPDRVGNLLSAAVAAVAVAAVAAMPWNPSRCSLSRSKLSRSNPLTTTQWSLAAHDRVGKHA